MAPIQIWLGGNNEPCVSSNPCVCQHPHCPVTFTHPLIQRAIHYAFAQQPGGYSGARSLWKSSPEGCLGIVTAGDRLEGQTRITW